MLPSYCLIVFLPCKSGLTTSGELADRHGLKSTHTDFTRWNCNSLHTHQRRPHNRTLPGGDTQEPLILLCSQENIPHGQRQERTNHGNIHTARDSPASLSFPIVHPTPTLSRVALPTVTVVAPAASLTRPGLVYLLHVCKLIPLLWLQCASCCLKHENGCG